MGIYNKDSPNTIPWLEQASREYGAPLVAVVDTHADIAPERLAWLAEAGIAHYFVPSYLIFFETEVDAMHYYLRWSSEDGSYS